MSGDFVVPCATCTELRAEVDRLRLLLQATTRKRSAWSVVMEPSAHGFNITVTGVRPDDETRIAQLLADYFNVLWRGAFRWSVRAYEVLAEQAAEPSQAGDALRTADMAHEPTDATVELERTGVALTDIEESRNG